MAINEQRAGRTILQRALALAQMPDFESANFSRYIAEMQAISSTTPQAAAVMKATLAYHDGYQAIDKENDAMNDKFATQRDALRAQFLAAILAAYP